MNEPTIDNMGRDLATARRWATTLAEEAWQAEAAADREVEWLRYVIRSLADIATRREPSEAAAYIRSACDIEIRRWSDG